MRCGMVCDEDESVSVSVVQGEESDPSLTAASRPSNPFAAFILIASDVVREADVSHG